ncbi:hypothetical protein BDQ94DRAFT_148365 [Aspergillus welwitschiae]|uniref:Uncharacterized protein n=1 Tax=Aspergillus welwitschiae TaxID=1341132 RepID=A0A3F3PV07_9EURO|nr:hypothetical protein BDQ94DRAFT_148365 [Aspergillus welwitschiae]RDH30705.1 hypothetical protein BDQ94DRAFT_148365 [Aspergillus welwitschiae]
MDIPLPFQAIAMMKCEGVLAIYSSSFWVGIGRCGFHLSFSTSMTILILRRQISLSRNQRCSRF